MSQTIREYKTKQGIITVNAFVGGTELGSAVQITTKDDYFQLSEEQCLDLISVLARRLNCTSKWNATGGENDAKIIDNRGKEAITQETTMKCDWCGNKSSEDPIEEGFTKAEFDIKNETITREACPNHREHLRWWIKNTMEPLKKGE